MSIDFDLVKKKIDAIEEKKKTDLEERKSKAALTREKNRTLRLLQKWGHDPEAVQDILKNTPRHLLPEVGYQAHCTGTDTLEELLPEGVRLLNEVPVSNPEEVKMNLLRLKWKEVMKLRGDD